MTKKYISANEPSQIENDRPHISPAGVITPNALNETHLKQSGIDRIRGHGKGRTRRAQGRKDSRGGE